MSMPLLAGGVLQFADYGSLKRAQRLISEVFSAELHDTLSAGRLQALCQQAQAALAEVEGRHQ